MEKIHSNYELENLLQISLTQREEIVRETERKYPNSRRLIEFLEK